VRDLTDAELNPKPQPAPKAAARQDESVLDKFRKIWKQEKTQAQPQVQPKQAEQPPPLVNPHFRVRVLSESSGHDVA